VEDPRIVHICAIFYSDLSASRPCSTPGSPEAARFFSTSGKEDDDRGAAYGRVLRDET
jgi:hypothetical protein